MFSLTSPIGENSTSALGKLILLALFFHLPGLPASAQLSSTHQLIDGGAIVLLASQIFPEPIDRSTLAIVDWPSHGTVSLMMGGSLEYRPEAAYSGFDDLIVRARLAADRSVDVEVGIELRVLPRAIPFAGRFDGGAYGAVGYYDPVGLVFDLCEPWPTWETLTCLQHPVPEAGEGWLPVVGDWNGDGQELPSLFDPTRGQLHLLEMQPGGTFPEGQGSSLKIVESIQLPSAVWAWPVAGDWNGEGRDRLALYTTSGTIRVIEIGSLATTVDTWSEPLSRIGASDDLPWPVAWRLPVPLDIDAVGVFDDTAFLWKARNGSAFLAGGEADQVPLNGIPVAHEAWAFGQDLTPYVFELRSPGLWLDSWRFGSRPATLPVKFPNDPSGR